MNTSMKGWKTKLGGALVTLSAVLGALAGSPVAVDPTIVDAIMKVGGVLIGVGVAHKIEKASN